MCVPCAVASHIARKCRPSRSASHWGDVHCGTRTPSGRPTCTTATSSRSRPAGWGVCAWNHSLQTCGPRRGMQERRTLLLETPGVRLPQGCPRYLPRRRHPSHRRWRHRRAWRMAWQHRPAPRPPRRLQERPCRRRRLFRSLSGRPHRWPRRVPPRQRPRPRVPMAWPRPLLTWRWRPRRPTRHSLRRRVLRSSPSPTPSRPATSLLPHRERLRLRQAPRRR